MVQMCLARKEQARASGRSVVKGKDCGIPWHGFQSPLCPFNTGDPGEWLGPSESLFLCLRIEDGNSNLGNVSQEVSAFFLRRGEGEREKHCCNRDTSIGRLPNAPRLGPGITLQPKYVPLT